MALFKFRRILAVFILLCGQVGAQDSTKAVAADNEFLSMLSAAGIFDAAKSIGLDAKSYLTPLAYRPDHPYRRYRWSVGYHEDGGPMISALPPEEEMGWTPWERWYKDAKGKTQKESWVMYPLKDPTASGVARWYRLEEDGLAPRLPEQAGFTRRTAPPCPD
jgi:hypothetical protein